MNKLIIIGNGFDLAHKLKTGYHHFIFWYISESFKAAIANRLHTDVITTIEKKSPYATNEIESYTDLQHFLQYLPDETAVNTGERFSGKEFAFIIHNKFIKHIFLECQSCGWVDIENEYYEALKELLTQGDQNFKKQNVQELNTAFAFLKEKLEEYLSQIDKPGKNIDYTEDFNDQIKQEEVDTRKGHISRLNPQQIMILNFNYTSTIESYFSIKEDKNVEIIYIHGKLKDKDNPIIFGFGDELDQEYSTLENAKVPHVLDYMKSFGYFRTSNYHTLLRFIDSDDYQVSIFGHSCGLSDRTMLNMVFENEKCTSIKIYYHERPNGTNNYVLLTQEISRHFKNKGEMRRKIVSFEYSNKMMQVE